MAVAIVDRKRDLCPVPHASRRFPAPMVGAEFAAISLERSLIMFRRHHFLTSLLVLPALLLAATAFQIGRLHGSCGTVLCQSMVYPEGLFDGALFYQVPQNLNGKYFNVDRPGGDGDACTSTGYLTTTWAYGTTDCTGFPTYYAPGQPDVGTSTSVGTLQYCSWCD